MQKKTGFTLIELLVVVLIIGILSAVALPQYEKAVMKTRAMSLLPMLRSINDAEQIYYLANDTYTIAFDDLDISLPPGATVSHESGDTTEKEFFTYNNWECFLQRQGDAASKNSYSAYCSSTLPGMPLLEKYFARDYFICWGGEAGSKGYAACQSITNTSTPTASSPKRGPGFRFS